MVTEELVSYIQEAKGRGRSVEEIKSNLLGAGWNEADVAEALVKVGFGVSTQVAVTPEKVESSPTTAKPSWGAVGSGAGGGGEMITLPQIDTGKIAPKVSMGEMPSSVSVMASVQPLDAGVVPVGGAKAVSRGGGFSRKWLKWIVLGIFLIGGGVGALAAYRFFFNNPLRIVSVAIAKTLSVDSFSMGVTLAENKQAGNFSGTVNYLKGAGKLAKAEFKVEAIGGDPEKTVTVSAIYGGDEIFFKPSYTQLAQLQDWLKGQYPKMEDLRVYQVAEPVFQKESWFEAKLPKGEMSVATVEKWLGVGQSNEAVLREKLIKSLVVRKFETTSIEGRGYYRIVLGVDKDHLVDLLATSQGTNNRSSTFGGLERAINTVSSWDVDLVEIMVDKNTDNLSSISIWLPTVSREAVASGLAGVNVGGLPILAVANYLPGQATGQVQYLGKLTFSNFGKPMAELKPMEVIDFGMAAELAKVELVPIFSSYLTHSRLPEPFEINIGEAKRLWEMGKYRDALTQAGNMIGMAKTDIQKAAVHSWIGASAYKLGDLSTAETEELLATTLDKKAGVPNVVLALVEINKQNFQRAYGYATKGVALEGGSAWAHNSLGLTLLGLNKKSEAAREFERALSLAPGDGEIKANLDKALGSQPPSGAGQAGQGSSLPTARPSPTPKAKTATSSGVIASPPPTASASGFSDL